MTRRCRLLAGFAALLLLIWSGDATLLFAQEEGRDPHAFDEGNPAIPETIQIPKGYESTPIERFIFTYPKNGRSRADDLMEIARAERAKLVETIGIDPGGVSRVYLAANEEDFHALQPGKRPLPGWVAGIAYPALNAMVLRQAGSQGQMIDLVRTFKHELSHLIFRHAVPGEDVPKWFVEGLAQWQAGEFDLDRSLRLAKAILAGRLIPLRNLMQSFPGDSLGIQLSYDQSYEFVNFLIGEYGQARFHDFMRKLARGEGFALSLETTYGQSVGELEQQWIDGLKVRYNWIPLISSGSALWGFATVLFLIGYWRVKRDRAKRMKAWEEEERARLIAFDPWIPRRKPESLSISKTYSPLPGPEAAPPPISDEIGEDDKGGEEGDEDDDRPRYLH